MLHTNDISQELQQNWIDYAMACNTDRAIPNAQDGLKPVAKRILWGMLDKTKAISSKPHIKSARIVGDIMGTYHPHGDSSIYEALIRLSRNWELRYPLIDVHGNNGNIMGDGEAAMRYTESRLSKITEKGMLAPLRKEAALFIPNYDETTVEPIVLPSVFPNLLCNPNTGIGVALANSWAPHNLGEVAAAINDYLDGKEPMLPGPDFPTGGIVINQSAVPAIMRSGRGSVKVRARYTISKQTIVFTEIPFGKTVETILDEIGENAEGISDIRNESNKNGIRIVIECEAGENCEQIVQHLFEKTSLQSSFSYNQVALVNGEPVLLNLQQAIEVYVKHNKECLVREYSFILHSAQQRIEIVNGLLKALEDIDNIIAFIKKSESAAAAKEGLIEKYSFTDNQAKAILAMKLASLAKLTHVELNNEAAELNKTISDCEAFINSEDKQVAEIRTRLADLVKEFGDARRTELTDLTEDKKALAADDKGTLMSVDCYGALKVEKKTVSPSAITSFKIGDEQTPNMIIAFSNGKVKKMSLEDVTRRTKILTKVPDGAKIIAAVPFKEDFLLTLVSKDGHIIKFSTAEFIFNKTAATGVMGIKGGDIVGAFADSDFIYTIDENGYGKKISSTLFSAQKRGGVGSLLVKRGTNLLAAGNSPILGGRKYRDTDFPEVAAAATKGKEIKGI